MPRVLKKCKGCEKEFKVKIISTRPWRGQYCSVACMSTSRRNGHLVQIKCQHCGLLFSRRLCPSQEKWSGLPKFCSKDCYKQFRRSEETRECLRCGEKFVYAQCSDKRRGRRANYCSDFCCYTYEIRSCRECGKEFKYHASRGGKHSGYYCCRECQSDFVRRPKDSIKPDPQGSYWERAASYAERSCWPTGLPPSSVAILNVISHVGLPVSRKGVCDAIGMTIQSSHQYFPDLIRSGLLVIVGSGRWTRYTLGPQALELLRRRIAHEQERSD